MSTARTYTLPCSAPDDAQYVRFLADVVSHTHGEPRWFCRQCGTHYCEPRIDCDWCAEPNTVARKEAA